LQSASRKSPSAVHSPRLFWVPSVETEVLAQLSGNDGGEGGEGGRAPPPQAQHMVLEVNSVSSS
jgi:hypothetical protein